MAARPYLRLADPNRDRHIRRGGEEYTHALLSLLPMGQAWPKAWDCGSDSLLYRVHRGLAWYWGFVDGRAADLLERESDPRRTVELLPDWERAWGLPDPCFPDATSIAERQKMLVLYMTYLGGQSAEYFEKLLEWLGFKIHVKEYAPFMAGISRAGDTRPLAQKRYDFDMENSVWVERTPDHPPTQPKETYSDDNFRWYIGPPEMRFTWTASVGRAAVNWFRAASGRAGEDPHMRLGIPEETQCLLNRWKPAHTHIALDLSHLFWEGSYQGTP